MWRTPWRRPTAPETSLGAVAGIELARDALGPLVAKRDLVEAAAARVGPLLAERFRRYVAWLDRQGYALASCEQLPLRFDSRRVYLRYDVHVRDLFGAFVLAGLHEELQVPGSFQICWEHSLAEAELSDIFLKLQAFDSRYVEFGLHCSPESGWIIAERFAGSSSSLEEFVLSGAGKGMIAEWLAAFERGGEDAPALVEARARAEARLAEITASFRRYFGAAKTLSGHGTALAACYLEAVGHNLRLAPLAPYLHPVDFLRPERILRYGFTRELTRFDEDPLPGPAIMFENPIGDMAARYRERMSGGGGFVVLFHPASWSGDHFASFLDAVAPPG